MTPWIYLISVAHRWPYNVISLTSRSVGMYVAIIYHIIKEDIIPFMVVISIVLFAFTGGFYLALRGEVRTGQNSTINQFTTSLDLHPSETE